MAQPRPTITIGPMSHCDMRVLREGLHRTFPVTSDPEFVQLLDAIDAADEQRIRIVRSTARSG